MNLKVLLGMDVIVTKDHSDVYKMSLFSNIYHAMLKQDVYIIYISQQLIKIELLWCHSQLQASLQKAYKHEQYFIEKCEYRISNTTDAGDILCAVDPEIMLFVRHEHTAKMVLMKLVGQLQIRHWAKTCIYAISSLTMSRWCSYSSLIPLDGSLEAMPDWTKVCPLKVP